MCTRDEGLPTQFERNVGRHRLRVRPAARIQAAALQAGAQRIALTRACFSFGGGPAGVLRVAAYLTSHKTTAPPFCVTAAINTSPSIFMRVVYYYRTWYKAVVSCGWIRLLLTFVLLTRTDRAQSRYKSFFETPLVGVIIEQNLFRSEHLVYF